MSSNRASAVPLPGGDLLSQVDAELVLRSEPAFPAQLHDLPEPPIFLTVRGALPIGGIAIVGSRRPPREASDFAYELARRAGVPVISGLALGIDSAAHRGALAAGLQTLAYVGCGLARLPRANRALADEIVACGGGIASAEWPDQKTSHRALVRRDAFQAAHASAVVLIASEASGGAMHTIRFAEKLGRARFALIPQDGRAYVGNRNALAGGAISLPWNVDQALHALNLKASHRSND